MNVNVAQWALLGLVAAIVVIAAVALWCDRSDYPVPGCDDEEHDR